MKIKLTRNNELLEPEVGLRFTYPTEDTNYYKINRISTTKYGGKIYTITWTDKYNTEQSIDINDHSIEKILSTAVKVK